LAAFAPATRSGRAHGSLPGAGVDPKLLTKRSAHANRNAHWSGGPARRPLARMSAATREQRMASEMVFLRDEAMVPGHGHGLEVIAHNCENRGRRGGQFTAGGALVAELAATRDTRQVPCREPHGYARGITKGMCKLSYLQLCRRINAPETVAFHGSLRVGGHDVTFRRRSGETVASAPPPAPRRAGHDDGTPWRHGRGQREPVPRARARHRRRRGVSPRQQQEHRQAGEVEARGREEERSQARRARRDAHRQGSGRGPDGRPHRRRRDVRACRRGAEGIRRAARGDGKPPPVHGDGAHAAPGSPRATAGCSRRPRSSPWACWPPGAAPRPTGA